MKLCYCEPYKGFMVCGTLRRNEVSCKVNKSWSCWTIHCVRCCPDVTVRGHLSAVNNADSKLLFAVWLNSCWASRKVVRRFAAVLSESSPQIYLLCVLIMESSRFLFFHPHAKYFLQKRSSIVITFK